MGSAYLVCDGESSGISAFVDQWERLRYWQKGGSSFQVNASFDAGKRTAYGAYGEVGALVVLLACSLVTGLSGFICFRKAMRAVAAARSLGRVIRELLLGKSAQRELYSCDEGESLL